MSGAMFTVAVGTSEVEPVLGKLAALLTDMTPVMDEVGAELVFRTGLRFEQSKSPDGLPWAPSRRAELEGGKTLVDTGSHLRDRVTHLAGPDRVEVGLNTPWAWVHQMGTTIKAKTDEGLRFKVPIAATDATVAGDGAKAKKPSSEWRRVMEVTLPARPFLGVNADDRDAVVEIFGRELTQAAEAAKDGTP